MHILAISGSLRKDSTNTTLLRAIQSKAPPDLKLELYEHIGTLPIFSPDLEGEHTPQSVIDFCSAVEKTDGIVLACPEYVRAIPGGLKNAIDWLVSRDEIISKPIALAHASPRGDDMLHSLRLVLNTVSEAFTEEVFLRIPLQPSSTTTVSAILENEEHARDIMYFLDQFRSTIPRN